MKNKKIIIIAASLVLAATLALCGCMHLIGEPPEETQRYDNDEMSVPSVIEETPTAQSEMQKKFGAYGKEAVGINGEKVFYLFTEEQIEESLQMRRNGERRSLTYDEITFIINDTIRIYQEYDQIVLTDFSEHTVSEKKMIYHKLSDPPKSSVVYNSISSLYSAFNSCLEKEEYKFKTIDTYHGDLSEYNSYYTAIAQYSTMLLDIERMIAERLRILDTGTLCYCNNEDGLDNAHFYGILLDSGSNKDYSQYIDAFEDCIDNKEWGDTNKTLIGVRNYDSSSPYQSVSICYYENRRPVELFPTAELKEMEPPSPIILHGSNKIKLEEEESEWVLFRFDVYAKTVEFLHVKKEDSSRKYGTYKVDAGKLILDFDGAQLVINYVDGKYVFAEQYYKDGEWIKFDEKIKMREAYPVIGNKSFYPTPVIIFPNSFK